jgi:hypothetical protein
MSKHKTVTHVPAAPAPSPPAPATPRLAAQLLTALGELVVVAAAVLGIVTAVSWALAGMDRTRIARQPQQPAAEWVCWVDRYGEICRPVDHRPGPRRYFARY